MARLSLFDGDWAPAAAGLQQGTTPFWTLAQDFVFLVLFSSCSGVICAMHNTDCVVIVAYSGYIVAYSGWIVAYSGYIVAYSGWMVAYSGYIVAYSGI